MEEIHISGSLGNLYGELQIPGGEGPWPLVIMSHGFGGGKNHLFVRLQVKEGRWTLRFRDDCAAFDPVSHIAEVEAPGESVGIRLAMRMADEARYTYSMNLNNLTLVLRDS